MEGTLINRGDLFFKNQEEDSLEYREGFEC
jgi:hypothetical protein